MSDLLTAAETNLAHFLSIANFRCEADREAAMNCLEVMSDALAARHAALARILENGDVRDAMHKGELSQARAAISGSSDTARTVSRGDDNA